MYRNHLSTVRKDYLGTAKLNIPKSELIGYYSVINEENYVKDISRLKYFTLEAGDVKMDLKTDVYEGKTHINSPNTFRGLFFKYLKDNGRILDELRSRDVMDAGIVTSRRCLDSIFNILHVKNKPIAFEAYYIKDHIYLCAAKTKKRNSDISSIQGHAFENFVLSDSPDEEPKPNQPVDEFSSFVGVYKLAINKHRLLVRCKIEGVLANSEGNREKIPIDLSETETADELKKRKIVGITSLLSKNKDNSYFRKVLSNRIWRQSMINNVNDIYIGYKNDEYVVTKIVKNTLKDLENRRLDWDPEVYLNFCNAFLTFVKKCLKDKVALNRNSAKPICAYFIARPKKPIEELPSKLPDDFISNYVPETYWN